MKENTEVQRQDERVIIKLKLQLSPNLAVFLCWIRKIEESCKYNDGHWLTAKSEAQYCFFFIYYVTQSSCCPRMQPTQVISAEAFPVTLTLILGGFEDVGSWDGLEGRNTATCRSGFEIAECKSSTRQSANTLISHSSHAATKNVGQRCSVSGGF